MELHDDDLPVGRVLTRREIIKLLGGAGASLIVGTGLTKIALAQSAAGTEQVSLPACVVRPAQTEGPYFVDERLNRFDIRIDPSDGTVKEGVPLHLKFQVSQVSTDACTPLQGAQVDVWHCDALGVYSDTEDPGFNTVGQKWLRGYQVTDANGAAEFMTIYPGWYQGRTVHIHFMIRTEPDSETGYEFTSQLFFPDELTDVVHAQAPYAAKGERTLRNEGDGIYQSGGDQLMLDPVQASADELAAIEATAEATMEATVEADGEGGYTATFDIGLDLSAPQTAVGPGGAPP
jgi:protocatechuate 3,4-dioxygenase beta subunit